MLHEIYYGLGIEICVCNHDEQTGLRASEGAFSPAAQPAGLNDKAQLLKIQELETQIEKNMEQRQVLTNLMAGGYLEPALFNKESNALAAEAETLRQEKENLMHFLSGNMERTDELQKLVRFVSKGTMLTAFEDEVFLSYVERVTVHSRTEVIFELKCGLLLKERLVD